MIVAIVGADAGGNAAADHLLDVLAWIRHRHPEVEVHVLLLRGGPRIHQFHALAPTTVLAWYDRRADRAGAAAVLRGPRRRRGLAAVIDQGATAMLPRRLPRGVADVAVVSGQEALGVGPVGFGRKAPLVVLLPTRDLAAASPRTTSRAGRDRRAVRSHRRASAVLTGTPAPADVWTAIEGARCP